MLAESIEGLQIQPEGIYVDGTFGCGGHAKTILQRLGPKGHLLALDRDPQATRAMQDHWREDPRFSLEQIWFSALGQCVQQRGWQGQVNGILFDLGVSSPQLDDPGRGFSFSQTGPLDMRMDPNTGDSAAGWLARASEEEIRQVLWEFGEERYAARIARILVATRQKTPILTTTMLASLVACAIPRWERDKHPATRTFQAIRIAINQELTELRAVLPQALTALAPGGRLVVLSFHSLEDRIVKRFIRNEAHGEKLPRDLPIRTQIFQPRLREIGKIVQAGAAEVAANPRSRSAVLRIAEKV